MILAGNDAHHSGYFNEIKGGARGPIIFGDYIHDSDGRNPGRRAGTGYQFLVHTDADFEARDVKVWNNVIVNVPREAFYVWACHDCIVAHTSYYDAPRPMRRSGCCRATSPTERRHRSHGPQRQRLDPEQPLLQRHGVQRHGDRSASETTGLAMSHNLWFAKGLATTAGCFPTFLFAGGRTSLYASDPRLIGAPASMRPGAASPVIGKGIGLPFALTNFDGIAWSGAPNMGAY